MSIKQLYKTKPCVLSLEVFPPKKQTDIDMIASTLPSLAAQKPDFISVTFGAGGSSQAVDKAISIASALVNQFHIPALSHLTCVGASQERMLKTTQRMKQENIQDILALRGDLPEGDAQHSDYEYAYDLIRHIKQEGGFDVGAACYPEGHIESLSNMENFDHLKAKQDAGADFFVSQLFFDNDIFYRFIESARAHGVTLPIVAGVMPILSRSQIERMIFMCGASLPSRIIKLLYRYQDRPDDLRQAGIAYSAEQAQDLLTHGVDGIHIYTMNQPDIAETVLSALR